VQSDGNFVLYAGDTPKWHSDTKGKKDVRLVLQDDRNVVLYSADGAAWTSRTETDAPPPPVVDKEFAPVANEVPAPAAPRTHTVAAGDTLFNIAKQYLGDGNRYQELAKANNIANPDHIEVGQVITIP
jgi:nucleoid-associated protein YgaU